METNGPSEKHGQKKTNLPKKTEGGPPKIRDKNRIKKILQILKRGVETNEIRLKKAGKSSLVLSKIPDPLIQEIRATFESEDVLTQLPPLSQTSSTDTENSSSEKTPTPEHMNSALSEFRKPPKSDSRVQRKTKNSRLKARKKSQKSFKSDTSDNE